nr:hypothetical protein [Tanacetum cinerariifolium]
YICNTSTLTGWGVTIDELTALCTSLQRQHSEMIAKLEAHEVEINRLKARVKLLEDREGVAVERSRNDAPIKGRNLDEGEAIAERVSDDSEEMTTVLTSMDAATILAGEVAKVPTGSGSIPTASPPTTRVATGSDVVPLLVAKELEEKMAREDQRKSEQIARDAEIARIYAEEELQIMIDTLDRIWKQLHDFVPIGSKEEAERFKRKGTRFEQESTKKLKTSEEVPEEVKSPDEVAKEMVKEVMQLVPIEEVYVKALQVKHPIIDWKAHTKGKRSYWKITSNRPPTRDKEMELWVELNRLYEPDEDDQLWTHTQNLMHALVEWKLYDSCGVHHVIARDKEIFMLVEKDYPLRKGLAIMMISYKLQVENYSRMANDLILKIFKIASTLRQQGNKMHKAIPLPVIEFPLPVKKVPTARRKEMPLPRGLHCWKSVP